MTKKIKVGMISLGCPKNQMDAELMLARLQNAGYELTAEYGLADVVVINTCGFIEDAKRESIDQILEVAQLKKEGQIQRIVVTGCLAERYQQELCDELPECDAVLGLGASGDIVEAVQAALAGNQTHSFPPKACWSLNGPRVRTTPGYYAYLRVGDGCNNCCTYCAIPSIRGPLRSRDMDTLVDEARWLAAQGVREVILVAQDTTLYGTDLYGRSCLPELLERLCAIDGLDWIRMLYCYPEHITESLLDVMATQDKIVKYLDVPIQHANGGVLSAMNRPGDAESLRRTFAHIRERVPGIVLRTTVMTGFPGEDQAAFEELCEFLQDVRFERLGCFAFSPEEDTPAYTMQPAVPEEIRRERQDIVMQQQQLILDEYQNAQVGKTLRVLVEEYDRYAACWYGHTQADAPEIDTKVFFTAPAGTVHSGDLVDVYITEALDCDLMGECCQ